MIAKVGINDFLRFRRMALRAIKVEDFAGQLSRNARLAKIRVRMKL
jgi:hypothetical protein